MCFGPTASSSSMSQSSHYTKHGNLVAWYTRSTHLNKILVLHVSSLPFHRNDFFFDVSPFSVAKGEVLIEVPQTVFGEKVVEVPMQTKGLTQRNDPGGDWLLGGSMPKYAWHGDELKQAVIIPN